ncbi:hypothetical protein D3C76_1019710 [compost metagenome]
MGRRDLTDVGLVPHAQLNHLGKICWHESEIGCGEIHALASHERDTRQSQYQGEKGCGEHEQKMTENLLSYRLGKMQADGRGNQPLTLFTSIRDLCDQPSRASDNDHR